MQPDWLICIIMLKNILAITGKSGLFKLVNRGNNMLIIESLLDGKRMPTYARDKIVSLADISMFTTGEDIPLRQVLENLKAKENGETCKLEVKKVDNEVLRTFFAEILPDFDRDRVYPSDIRKLIQWYNILINAGITDFSEEEQEETENIVEETAQVKNQKPVRKSEGKAQKATIAKTKNNIGAKKG